MSEESHQIFEIDVERFDCKRSQCFFVDKWSHSISLINVQPEENFEGKMCLNHPKNVFIKISSNALMRCFGRGVLDAEFWMRSFDAEFWMRSFDAEFRCVIFDALFSTRCFRRGVFDALFSQLKKLLSVDFEKKFGVDWPRLSQFQKKNFKESNVENEKSAWTGLDKVKKAFSAASVF